MFSGRGALKLDASAGFDATVEVVFYLTHLGDDVREFDEFGGSVSSGENELDVGGTALD
jgi:hypothetical protein